MYRQTVAKFRCGEGAKARAVPPGRLAATFGVTAMLLVATFPDWNGSVGRAFAAALQPQIQLQQAQREDPLDARRLAVLKAGAVRHLPGHTEWPEKRFNDDDNRLAPIVILVVGQDGHAFERYLEEVTAGQRAHDRRLVVRRTQFPRPQPGEDEPAQGDLERLRAQLLEAHVLYIGESERSGLRFRRILEMVDGHAILTVSAIERFADRGGMLHLTVRENRLAMDANIDLIRKADLRVSSRLLRLARIVRLPQEE